MSTGPLSPEALMGKAETAGSSAQHLLDVGDVDGAVNRAYYAMFDAARAALLSSGAPVDADIGRTHSGLIAAFGNFLVKNGPIDKEMGRALNRAHEIRLVADYNNESVDEADARAVIEQAQRFIATIKSTFSL